MWCARTAEVFMDFKLYGALTLVCAFPAQRRFLASLGTTARLHLTRKVRLPTYRVD